MSNYVIGIGGTGAKCVEALVHLCACGCLDGELTVRFVDKDLANGSLERAMQSMSAYRNVQRLSRRESCDFIRTTLNESSPLLWSPMQGHDETANLDDLMQHGALEAAANQKEAQAKRLLYETLYSRSNRKVSLNWGFLGRPSIGAAVFAKEFDFEHDPCWNGLIGRIRQELNTASPPTIFLFASIFGGTGASGLPTIARLIRQACGPNLRIGALLMLPYFSFQAENELNGARHNGNRAPDSSVFADSNMFMQSSAVALKYYYDHFFCDQQNCVLNAVYYAGDPAQTPVSRFARGSQNQKNEPHYVELVAALGAVDFFRRTALQPNRNHFLSGHMSDSTIHWSDLPVPADPQATPQVRSVDLRKNLGTHAYFAFSYLSYFSPLLQDLRNSGRAWRAPWYVDHFIKRQLQVNPDLGSEQDPVRMLSESYLYWLACVQNSLPDNQIRLVHFDAIAQIESQENGKQSVALKAPPGAANTGNRRPMDVHDLSRLLYKTGEAAETHSDKHGIHKLWEILSCYPSVGNKHPDMGKFLSALYDSCREYYKRNQ